MAFKACKPARRKGLGGFIGNICVYAASILRHFQDGTRFLKWKTKKGRGEVCRREKKSYFKIQLPSSISAAILIFVQFYVFKWFQKCLQKLPSGIILTHTSTESSKPSGLRTDSPFHLFNQLLRAYYVPGKHYCKERGYSLQQNRCQRAYFLEFIQQI